jgi:hypothetical protein
LAPRQRALAQALPFIGRQEFSERMTSMSQSTQIQGFNRVVKAPARTRKYTNEQVPLGTYLLHGAAGMAFMMFTFWLAGFGS